VRGSGVCTAVNSIVPLTGRRTHLVLHYKYAYIVSITRVPHAARRIGRTADNQTPFPELATPFDLLWGIDNGSKELKDSFICSNWPKAYQYYDIGNADIEQYSKRDFIKFVDFKGLPFTHCSVVAQNTVPKPGADPEWIRRRVLDHSFPREDVVIDGRTYEMLALNSRIDIEQEADELFSSWGALESKATRAKPCRSVDLVTHSNVQVRRGRMVQAILASPTASS
jgi:hypothetical protein